jgi:hypothetical protein
MQYATTVRLFVDGAPEQILRNVKVSLYDRDRVSADDLLGTVMTDERGEARFSFTSEQFVDLDDHFGGVFPDLYAVVHDSADKQVLSLRSETIPNTPRKHILIPIARALALQHGLIAP